jgi:GNAT superfamily N-acetyltransferase
MKPNIFPATPAHYPIIRDIATETWGPTYGHILTEAQTAFMLEWMYSMESINDQANNKGHHFLMVEVEARFVGFAAYELDYKGLSKTKIHKLYVQYAMHGSGIGKTILDFISDIASVHGNQYLNLNVNRFNQAIGFYKKTGFEIIGEEDIDIGHGYLMEDYIMEKAI